MTMYTLSFLCAFAGVQVPGTSAKSFTWSISKGGNNGGSSSSSSGNNGGSSSSSNGNQGGSADMSTNQNEVVNKHNDLRRGVNPTASNMLKMSWSNDIGANAQAWADTCAMDHSSSNSRIINNVACGENLYMSSAPDSWSDAIQDWYDEVKDWQYGVGSINGGMVGHYTQVVWYSSYQVGCGRAYCPNSRLSYFYVCQYCPAGNVNGNYGYPYKSGPTCGDCPHDCDNGLCTNPCPYLDEYSNCPQLKQQHSCNNRDVASWCPASCQCTDKIY